MSAVALLLAPILWLGFRRLERTDRATTVVAIIWGLLLVETALFVNQSSIPAGVFHPEIGGVSLRLVDMVVVAALAARLTTTGVGRFRITGILWTALLVWLTTAAFFGVVGDNPFDQIMFESRAILYLGAMLLTAGIPARRYLEGNHLPRLIWVAAALAALLLVTDTGGIEINLGAGPAAGVDALQDNSEPIDPFGALGADAATIFVTFGVIALALAAVSADPRRRLWLMLASAPLLASTLGPGQRAAYLGAIVALAVLAFLLISSRRPLQIRPFELVITGLALVTFLIGPTVIASIASQRAAELPFQEQVVSSVSSGEKKLSAQDRVNQFEQAKTLIAERPLFGWGLGRTYEYYSPGLSGFVETDITHNIATDLLLRSGAVGLGLFLAALLATLWRGLRAWYRNPDLLLAALSAALVAAVTGLIAKGLVESIFEKYRLALALALLIGMLLSAAAPEGDDSQGADRLDT